MRKSWIVYLMRNLLLRCGQCFGRTVAKRAGMLINLEMGSKLIEVKAPNKLIKVLKERFDLKDLFSGQVANAKSDILQFLLFLCCMTVTLCRESVAKICFLFLFVVNDCFYN